jgi:hypothetical protein
MKQLVLIAMILAFPLSLLLAQTIHLDVMMDDTKCGDINVVAKKQSKQTEYEMTSNVKVKMLFEITMAGKTNDVFKDGKLFSSNAKRVSSIGSENKETKILWDGKKYTITKSSDDPSTVTTPITFCLTDLYFKEPTGVSQVFSEMQGIYLPLTNLQNNQYQLQVNDSKKDIYTYANGKLVKVETVMAMKKVMYVVR